MTWTEDAETLIEATVETGLACAEAVAAAWRAGVGPEATDSLAAAAVALGAAPADLLNGGLRPLPNDLELIIHAADLETAAANHLHDTRTLSEQVTGALDAALAAAAAAARVAAKTKNDTDAHAARKAAAAAQRQIADCEHALEILIPAGEQATRALDCLGQVPDDLVTAYERVYEHLRTRRTLPFHGDFLTGARV